MTAAATSGADRVPSRPGSGQADGRTAVDPTCGHEASPGGRDPSSGDAAATLAALLDEAAGIHGVAGAALAALRAKVREHAFNLVVAGEFKRGKSTLINALVGAELLPTAVVPLTSVVTRLEHAAAPRVEVGFEDGEVRAVGIDALPDYVTERGNPGNAKGVHEVRVGATAPWLAGGLRLVDTPGIGSVHQHNTEVTRRYLPQADAVIFVASADQPLGRNELDFLADIRRHAGKVFCLLNKIDHLSEAEVAESVAFATRVVHEAMGEAVPVFPLSARLALHGNLAHDDALLARSGLPAFDAALQRFLAQERGAVWARSVRQQLARLLDETRLALELERGALAAQAALLDARLQAFAARKAESLQARSDFDALLQADSLKLLEERVEPAIEAFAKTWVQRLNEGLERWADELRPQGSAALQLGLEERTVDEVRRAFDAWREEEDARTGLAFDEICARFTLRSQQTVDELLRFSAGLFEIAYTGGGAEAPWQTRGHFRYKFWTAPPSLQLPRCPRRWASRSSCATRAAAPPTSSRSRPAACDTTSRSGSGRPRARSAASWPSASTPRSKASRPPSTRAARCGRRASARRVRGARSWPRRWCTWRRCATGRTRRRRAAHARATPPKPTPAARVQRVPRRHQASDRRHSSIRKTDRT